MSNGNGVIWYTQNIYASGSYDFGANGSDNITFKGSSTGDTVNLGVNRAVNFSGNLTADFGGGNDSLVYAHLKNSDVINMGAGDDTIEFGDGGNWSSMGIATGASFQVSTLDGGAGNDTLVLTNVGSSVSGLALNLNFGNATNFENITGSLLGETITGDANDNILKTGVVVVLTQSTVLVVMIR